MDHFSKTCLALIVVLLSMIVLRPVLSPLSAAAAHRYKYTVVCGGCETSRPHIDDTLNFYALQGWEFVEAIPGQPSQPFLIFRK
ncbi:MAG TPA: hypothetical protein VH640_21025 [Bryobacteraceae bacterium]|jgi:hypothetical protein